MDTNEPIQQQLGDFEIIRELGRGGMGVVYEVRQKSLNRRVALKVLSSGLGLTTKAVKRFRREAEAAAKLHHTNIVPVYSTGEHNGIHYYAMELVDGPSLDQVIKYMREATRPQVNSSSADSSKGAHRSSSVVLIAETIGVEPPTPRPSKSKPTTGVSASDSSINTGAKYYDSIASMIADVADALDHAHSQGVIHRDIKPSNLLLSSDGRLSVNDFGLARVLEQPGMTMTGEFVGSPVYMSPEQISAGRAPLDHRTDIYSLGATLYEVLTFEPARPGKTRDEVIAHVLHREVKPPRSINRAVPVDLETICLKSLERDPARRYQSAGEMARDLRNYVQRYSISARRTGAIARAVKYARRNPANAALVAMVSLVVLVGLSAIYAYRWQAKRDQLQDVQREVLDAILRGDFANARESQEAANELGASKYWDRFTDGQISLFRGDYRSAAERLEAALELKPGDIPAKSLLAVAKLWSGDEIAYMQGLKEIETAPATTFHDFLYLGYANTWLKPEEALRLLIKAESKRSNLNIVRLFRAQAKRFCAMKIGWSDPEQAMSHALAAIKEAETSTQTLQDSPTAYAELALANLVASRVATDSSGDKSFGAQSDVDTKTEYELATGLLSRLAELSGNDDAQYARFLILAETDKSSVELRRFLDVLSIHDRQQNPYFFQCAGALYFQFGDSVRADWLRATPGAQGENCRFMEFYLEICEDGFSPSKGNLSERVKAYIDRKIAADNAAYLEFDWSVVALIGDAEYAQHVIDKMIQLKSFDIWRDIYGYLARRGPQTPEALLEACARDMRLWCEANFFLAIEALVDGEHGKAREYFRQSMSANMFLFYAHWWSRAFLAHMNRHPEWPSWHRRDLR